MKMTACYSNENTLSTFKMLCMCLLAEIQYDGFHSALVPFQLYL